jgi:hypothetical protein
MSEVIAGTRIDAFARVDNIDVTDNIDGNER